MIGTWQDSAKLGVVAVGLWATAYGWYFIGNQRLGEWITRLLERLRLRAPPDVRAQRRARREAVQAKKAQIAADRAAAHAALRAQERSDPR